MSQLEFSHGNTKTPAFATMFPCKGFFTTNFPDTMQAAVKLKLEKQPDVPDPFSLHDRIRHNFKKLPDENWWKRGLFKDLKLKPKFYRSDLAKRIFKKMFGLRSCAVRIDLPTKRVLLPTESVQSVNVEGPLEVRSQIELRPPDESTSTNSSPKRRLIYPRKQVQKAVPMTKSGSLSSPLKTSSKEDEVVEVPLQIESSEESSIHNFPPKRRVKYPQTRTDTSMIKSGIRFFRSKFVEQTTSTHPEGFIDENFISPTEPAPVSSKRISIISDIVLVPAKPFKDEIVQLQSPESNLQSKRNKPSKRNIVPIARVHQRGVVYEEATEELTVQLPVVDVSNERLSNLSKPKPRAGPKSRMALHKNSSADSQPNTAQQLLQDLMMDGGNPLRILTSDKSRTKVSQVPPERLQKSPSKISATTKKPRIGPKSVMLKQQKSKLPPEKLPKLTFIEPNVTQATNVIATPKRKIGPKSRMIQSKSSFVEELNAMPTHDLVREMMHIDAVQSILNEESPEQSKNTQANQPSNETCQTSLSRPQIKSKTPSNADNTETPCHAQQTYPPNQLQIAPQESGTLTQCSDSLRFEKKLKQSVERASQHLKKYVAEMGQNAQSIKQFWYDFLKTEYEDDNSAAETQLFSTQNDVEPEVATQNDVELEVHSQAILHPNRLNEEVEQMEVQNEMEVQNVDVVQNVEEVQNADEAQNVNEIQVEPEAPPVVHLDSSNSNELLVELQSPVDDPHPVQSVDYFILIPENEIKVEKVSNDHNETYSSKVQIIELPAHEPIEILQDDTADLFDILQVHGNDSEDLCSPLAISAPISNPVVAGSSRGFLTSLPVIPSKKRNYQTLDIVVEPVHRVPVTEFNAFSLQHVTPPSDENYQMSKSGDSVAKRSSQRNPSAKSSDRKRTSKTATEQASSMVKKRQPAEIIDSSEESDDTIIDVGDVNSEKCDLPDIKLQYLPAVETRKQARFILDAFQGNKTEGGHHDKSHHQGCNDRQSTGKNRSSKNARKSRRSHSAGAKDKTSNVNYQQTKDTRNKDSEADDGRNRKNHQSFKRRSDEMIPHSLRSQSAIDDHQHNGKRSNVEQSILDDCNIVESTICGGNSVPGRFGSRRSHRLIGRLSRCNVLPSTMNGNQQSDVEHQKGNVDRQQQLIVDRHDSARGDEGEDESEYSSINRRRPQRLKDHQ